MDNERFCDICDLYAGGHNILSLSHILFRVIIILNVYTIS